MGDGGHTLGYPSSLLWLTKSKQRNGAELLVSKAPRSYSAWFC